MTRFAPTTQQLSVVENAEEIRRSHIKVEHSIKTVSYLYSLGGVILTIELFSTIASTLTSAEEVPLAFPIIVCLIFAGLAVFLFFVGSGLRQLKPWARKAAVVYSFFVFSEPTRFTAQYIHSLPSAFEER